MCKSRFRSSNKVNASHFVDEARNWALALVRWESRFPGDYGAAMRRVVRSSNVPFGLLWNLHYRTPKTIPVEKYVALAEAFADAQRKHYCAERSAVKAKTSLGRYLLGASDRLVSEDDGAVT